MHNYIVEQLAVINEAGRFTKPKDGLPTEISEKAWKKYDNDLFQTGRLICCGFYINITLYDYLRTIVNLNRSNTTVRVLFPIHYFDIFLRLHKICPECSLFHLKSYDFSVYARLR